MKSFHKTHITTVKLLSQSQTYFIKYSTGIKEMTRHKFQKYNYFPQ